MNTIVRSKLIKFTPSPVVQMFFGSKTPEQRAEVRDLLIAKDPSLSAIAVRWAHNEMQATLVLPMPNDDPMMVAEHFQKMENAVLDLAGYTGTRNSRYELRDVWLIDLLPSDDTEIEVFVSLQPGKANEIASEIRQRPMYQAVDGYVIPGSNGLPDTMAAFSQRDAELMLQFHKDCDAAILAYIADQATRH